MFVYVQGTYQKWRTHLQYSNEMTKNNGVKGDIRTKSTNIPCVVVLEYDQI